MAGTGPQDLFSEAQALLSAAEAALDTIPTFAPGLAGAPERTYIALALPAFDCEQLTVHVTPTTDKPMAPLGTGQRHRYDARRTLVSFVVTVARCVCPEDQRAVPTVTQMEGFSEQLYADAWALWNHLFNLMRAEELFSLCSEVFWRGLRAVPQSGCYAGWTLTLDAYIEGYEETL